MIKKLEILLLTSILIFGLFFRIVNHTKQSYWIDEAPSSYDASKESLTELLFSLKKDQPVTIIFKFINYAI